MKVFFRRLAYVINSLRAKILININIITLEVINLIISKQTNYINSYRIIFELEIALLTRLFLKRDMLIIAFISILTHFNITILIDYIDLSVGDNFIFKLIANYLVVLFVFLINFFFYIVLARNNSNILIKLLRKL